MDCVSDHIHVTGDIHITLTESVENGKNKNRTRQVWFCGKNFFLTASLIFHADTFLKAEIHWLWTYTHPCGMRIRSWNEVFGFIVGFSFNFLKIQVHDTTDVYRTISQLIQLHVSTINRFEILEASKVLQVHRRS